MRRVVVTGIGTVNPLGNNVVEFWKNILENKSGIGYITHFDTTDFPVKIAGEVKNFQPEAKINRKDLRKMDLYAQYALYAAIEAIEDSGLPSFKELNKERVGVYIASGIGGIGTLENQVLKLNKGGVKKVSPFCVPMIIGDIASGWISMRYGYMGPNFGLVSACASSTHAIGESFRVIKYGYVDVMVVGGAEAPITPLSIAGFAQAGALSRRNNEPEKASRPFDKDRDGFIVAEGAGVLILEELEHAKKRGAKIYAEIVGYGATADAYHITAPHPEGKGAILCMKNALKEANLSPEDIDYINAHGTSTLLNDKAETKAIKEVFGKHAYKIPVNSTKSMVGHLLGAAGAVETITTILSIKEGIVHRTLNLENPDPECDLDYVPNKSRPKEIKRALIISRGRGGINAVLTIERG